MILAVIFLAALAALCTYLADSLTDGTGFRAFQAKPNQTNLNINNLNILNIPNNPNNLNIHMWSNFKFLHMTSVENSEISPHVYNLWCFVAFYAILLQNHFFVIYAVLSRNMFLTIHALLRGKNLTKYCARGEKRQIWGMHSLSSVLSCSWSNLCVNQQVNAANLVKVMEDGPVDTSVGISMLTKLLKQSWMKVWL